MAVPTPQTTGHDSSNYYYFFLAVAAVAILLFVSNVMAVGCCSPCQLIQAIRRILHLPGGSAGDVGDRSPQLIPVCKYQKELEQGNESDTECSVCLSVFVEGEEVRQLPECKHSFHAPCIDMWLYSHSNCPLCRANVSLPTFRRPSVGGEDTRQPLTMLSSSMTHAASALM